MKQFVQERDRNVCCSACLFLCFRPYLLRAIESGTCSTYEEIKFALERTLWLLGSANTQLSFLRWQRILAAIQRAIKISPFSKEGFYSRLFLVPVNDGQMRPVIGLSSQTLNKFIINEHFQMENLSCFKTLFLPGDLTTSADLRNTYLSVAVLECSHTFLHFIWKRNCYQFFYQPVFGSPNC